MWPSKVSSFHAAGHAVFLDVKSNLFSWLWFRGCHQLPDSLKQGADTLIVILNLAFQVNELVCQFLMQRQRFSQTDEDPHYGDVYVGGTRTAQHARQHGDTLLGENTGQIFRVLSPL
jgi:hypothetical protein